MRIWIDLENSPHVMLFAPIVRELRQSGVEFLITVRDFSQTRRLAERHGLEFTTIGRHSHSSLLIRKGANTLYRAFQLRRFVMKRGVSAAVSHGSRTLAVAARLLSIPVLTLDDYEFSSQRMLNLLSDRVLVPAVIPEDRLVARGLDRRKLVRYPGLKEEVYVYDFRPDASVLEEFRLDPHRVIVTVRPPAPWAHYHEPLGDLLFRALIGRLKREANIQVVVSARTEAQEAKLREQYGLSPEKFHVHSRAVDGLSLMWFSDAVFGGGGTMVREAALLGINTYSVFGGRLGAADEFLVSQGRLRLLRTPGEIDELSLPARRTDRPAARTRGSMAPFIAQEVVRFVAETLHTGFGQQGAPLKGTQNPSVNA